MLFGAELYKWTWIYEWESRKLEFVGSCTHPLVPWIQNNIPSSLRHDFASPYYRHRRPVGQCDLDWHGYSGTRLGDAPWNSEDDVEQYILETSHLTTSEQDQEHLPNPIQNDPQQIDEGTNEQDNAIDDEENIENISTADVNNHEDESAVGSTANDSLDDDSAVNVANEPSDPNIRARKWREEFDRHYAEQEERTEKRYAAVLTKDWTLRKQEYIIRECGDNYTLIPECRSCLRVFATKEELETRLQAKPMHRRPFVRRRYNPVYPHAHGEFWRRRWTCARGFGSDIQLYRHLAKFKDHRRHGMIPRWTRDNKRCERKWKARKVKLKAGGKWTGYWQFGL